MFERMDQYLVDWLRDATGGAAITIGPPVATPSEPEVNLHLLDLLAAEPTQGPRRHPLQLLLRYLVTVQAPDAAEEHALLGRTAFAALEHPKIQPEFTRIESELWRAFGVSPRPAFFLRAPVSMLDTTPLAPAVSAAPEVRVGAVVPLRGTLVTPGGRPISQATVMLPELRQATKTDERGGFVFPSVPPEPSVKRLKIRAKGKEQEVEASLSDLPLIVEFNPGES